MVIKIVFKLVSLNAVFEIPYKTETTVSSQPLLIGITTYKYFAFSCFSLNPISKKELKNLLQIAHRSIYALHPLSYTNIC